MARLCEDTVVMALRDAQWMKSLSGDQADDDASVFGPPPMIKLDGVPEQTLGDLVFRSGEMFYLFEVKSTQREIKEEWSKKNKDGTPRRKKAYETLVALVSDWKKETDEKLKAEFDHAVLSSLRCHHFVYWSDKVFDANDTFGNIMVQPYIAACMRYRSQGGNGAATMPIVRPIPIVGQMATDDSIYTSEMLPLSAVLNQNGHVLSDKHRTQMAVKEPHMLGEDLARFQQYINFLCKSAAHGSAKMHAIICSNMGFAREARDMSQLAALLEKTDAEPVSNPSTTVSREAVKCKPLSAYSAPRYQPFPGAGAKLALTSRTRYR